MVLLNKEKHKIGYARISDKDQNFARQIESLNKAGCYKIYTDDLSGKDRNRPALKEMLSFIREGDIVVVSELDRLGRNNKELTRTLDEIRIKGATIKILDLPSLRGVEDDNLRQLLQNLIIELYKYQAEKEREAILERQRQGIEIAKKQGKYKGKPFKYSKDNPRLKHAFELFKQGLSDREVEEKTGINERTFRRYRQRAGIYRKDY